MLHVIGTRPHREMTGMIDSQTEVLVFRKDTPLPKGPDPFLVDGVLQRSLTVLYGQTCVGKTMLAISLAAAVADGRKWLGQRVASNGPVAIVSGDPDGKYEIPERLDKIRDELGNGEVRIIVPRRPMAEETWEQVNQDTEGCRLVFLDNLSQFIPGSLNNDDSVKLVYQELDQMTRRGIAVCVLAHTSDKRGENGRVSDVPLGSSFIRFGPRWFAYAHRARGNLIVSFDGNGGRPWELTLTEPTGTPRFEVVSASTADELASRRAQRARERDKAKLDRTADIDAWLKAEPKRTQRDAAQHFKVSQATVSRAVRGIARAT
jgi:AAA domain